MLELAAWRTASHDERVAALRFLGPPESISFASFVAGDGPGALDEVAVFREERSGLEFSLIPGGEYLVGAPAEDTDRRAVEPIMKRVRVSPYLISRTEVTQSAWSHVMETNPSEDVGPQLPVDSMTWREASEFCQRLGMRLPTEVQWEVAARGGATTAMFTGDDIGSISGFANIADASFGPLAAKVGVWWHDWHYENINDGSVAAAPAASYRPNQFGLFDVVGNVSEWCRDTWSSSPNWAGENPLVESPTAVEHVVRGSFWGSEWVEMRSASRRRQAWGHRARGRGFRVVIPIQVRDG